MFIQFTSAAARYFCLPVSSKRIRKVPAVLSSLSISINIRLTMLFSQSTYQSIIKLTSLNMIALCNKFFFEKLYSFLVDLQKCNTF